MKRVLLFLLTACASFGAVTDVVIPQRDANGRNQYITITGSSNTWEAVGFNGSGVLTSLTITDLLTNGSPAITSAMLTDGTVALADMANLAQSTLIGRHTASTGVPQAITVGGDFSLAGGTLSLANSYALASDVGTSKSGTQANPTTTNPLAPTWATQDYIVYYGATGEIDLPAASGYTNKTLLIYSTGTFTITVDPNGSEIIVETGASLGAGTADVISGTAGLLVGYTCDGVRWIKLEGGSGGAPTWASITSKPDTLAGFGITDGQPLDEDLTEIAALATPAADRLAFYDFSAGAWAYLTVGTNLSITGTTLEATAGGGGDLAWTNLSSGTALTIGNNYYDAFTTGRTLTFTGTPAQGNTVRLNAAVSSGPITLTIPTSYRVGNESTDTTVLLQNGTHLLTWQYVDTKWVLADSAVDAEAAYTLYGNFTGSSAAPAFSSTGVLDFGPWTSLELPNAAAPAVDAFGEIAGDNDLWAASRGSLITYDGTAATALVGVLVSDTPSNGQVPKWNTGGTITWENDTSAAGLASTDIDTSVELRTLVTDETGTGALVFADGAIGAATATTPTAADNDTSVATTAFVQGEVDGTATGSWASPYTTASTVSPTWNGPFHAVYMGVAQTVALPDAAAYAGRGILVYNTGAFTVTIDPDADDFVVRDGTAQADGINFTLSSGAGNYVALVSDGANWLTLGYKGTLSAGS